MSKSEQTKTVIKRTMPLSHVKENKNINTQKNKKEMFAIPLNSQT